MMLRTLPLSPVLLIRPGATELDVQGRIKGSLDMPLSEQGHQQVELLVTDVESFQPKVIYCAPCESAIQTANRLAQSHLAKVKIIEAFRNVDHGLWHGKLIDELKLNHPKVYKLGKEAPAEICPPDGESFQNARERIEKVLRKVLKKSGGQLIAIVIPDPMAGIVQGVLSNEPLGDLWESETDNAKWGLIEPLLC